MEQMGRWRRDGTDGAGMGQVGRWAEMRHGMRQGWDRTEYTETRTCEDEMA